mmetsp:Transcript_113107/g.178776  ORF Transcript_113107/g.178776 Transcript_113107/m.178776 type:complete len:861 (-) Transcript_113107:50-2632(-)
MVSFKCQASPAEKAFVQKMVTHNQATFQTAYYSAPSVAPSSDQLGISGDAILPHIRVTYQAPYQSPISFEQSQNQLRQSGEEHRSKDSGEKLHSGAEVSLGKYSFRVISLLGCGNQGSVWSAMHTDGTCGVAIKETICASESDLVAAEREPVIMHSIVGVAKRSRDAIVSPEIIACETTGTQLGGKIVRVAMAKIPGDSLTRFLQNLTTSSMTSSTSSVDECICEANSFAFALLSQMTAAFQTISTVALHRDISAENVIVSTNNGASDPKFGLIDFGLAAQIEVWPTQMTEVCAVGNCHYWPVSSWYIFMYGGRKLLDYEGLRMEYMTQLDLHGLGLLGLQVFLNMLSRHRRSDLPEELLNLNQTWDQCWTETRSLCEHMHRVSLGLISWDEVRDLYIRKRADHIIEAGFTRLHIAMAKVSDACVRAGPQSSLSNIAKLFEAFRHLISNVDREGRSNQASWSSVQAILGNEGKHVSADSTSTMPGFWEANSCTSSERTPPEQALLVKSGTVMAPLPKPKEELATKRDLSKAIAHAANEWQSPAQQAVLLRSGSIMAPLPKPIEELSTQHLAKSNAHTSSELQSSKKQVGLVKSGTVMAPLPKPKEELVTERSGKVMDKVKLQSLSIDGASGANAGVINGIYDMCGAYNDMPSWQKRGDSRYWLLMMNSKWWVTDAHYKAATRITGWAKSAKAKSPTSAVSWEVWDGSTWTNQSIIVSMEHEVASEMQVLQLQAVEEVDEEDTAVMENGVLDLEKVVRELEKIQNARKVLIPQVEVNMNVPQVQIFEKTVAVPQVQSIKEFPITPQEFLARMEKVPDAPNANVVEKVVPVPIVEKARMAPQVQMVQQLSQLPQARDDIYLV